jgi:tetratricopeptide (TPR) repeat protein
MRVLMAILALASALGGCRAPDTEGSRRTESDTPATTQRAPAVPDPSSSTSVKVPADPHIVLTSDCTRRTMIDRNPNEAVETCTRALDAANALPADRLDERIKAHSNLGEAYVVARRWSDAIREFETALRLEQPLAANSYRGGERLGMIAMSYFNLGDLQNADFNAGRAVATLKAVTTANEDERRVLTGTLQSMLQMQARFKRLHGDEKGAARLESEAEALEQDR